uniref:Uncharacterized protein n=1 Tax=Manihot esculenta TaxID=3983 RepID=A0A2C9V8Z7_MANES
MSVQLQHGNKQFIFMSSSHTQYNVIGSACYSRKKQCISHSNWFHKSCAPAQENVLQSSQIQFL